MNTSQTIAWLICLLLAFFATVLAVRSSYQATLLERRFAEVSRVADDEQALLGQIRDLLQRIEQRTGGEEPPAAASASGAEQPAAETAPTWPAEQ